MATFVISDLHLEASRPRITALFADFVHDLPGDSRLLILGDLFEAWIGDDDESDLAHAVQATLNDAVARGIRTSFIAGNRDFLVGNDYAARCGFDVLDDGIVLQLEGIPTLLMHGDTLCTADVAYQAFRAQVRAPAWQAAFLAQSIDARRAFAAQAREQSAKHTQAAEAAIMDVSPEAVAAALRDAGVSRLVHGHTHRPAVHAFDIEGRACERIVLGDWYRWGSVLRLDGDRVELTPIGV